MVYRRAMNDIGLPAAPEARLRALRTRARLFAGPSLAAAASAALTLLAPAAASASDPAAALGALHTAVMEALAELTFYSQTQIGAAAAVSDWGQPGGVSLRASMSLFGIGSPARSDTSAWAAVTAAGSRSAVSSALWASSK